jgi:hypothetical protein
MRTRGLTWGFLAVPVLVATAACGGGGGPAATTTSTIATTTTLPTMPADFNWWTPTPTPIGHGWTIGPCAPGAAPATKGKALCLTTKSGHEAVVEHFRFAAPADSDLNSHAAQFVKDFIADRKAGCGEAYVLDADPIVALDLHDGPAKRYGFTGGYRVAPKTERTVQWAGIRGPALVIISISGYDPGSCIPNTGQGTLQDLDEVVPGLNALVLAAGLPPLTP